MTSTIVAAAPRREASSHGASSLRSSRRSASRRSENLTGWALAAPAALLIALFFALPFGLTVWMSFFDWPTFGVPEPVGGRNYGEILTSPKFGEAVGFTVMYTVITSVLGIMLSLGLALLVRPTFPGRTGVGRCCSRR